MKRLRVGVIGVGHLGWHHARLYREIPGCDLAGVTDRDNDRALAVASELGCRAYDSAEALLSDVEAVSLAVPTPCHASEGLKALHRGVHLMIEKPIASTLEEADRLIESAAGKGLVLQVGHVERFSGAVQAALRIAENPRFLECHRLAGFSARGTEVAVVLDLMIHDVDIALALVGDGVKRVEAVGVPVLTDQIDIANARLEFRNGAIANLTASRVSREKMRKIRFFQPSAYVSIDCVASTAEVYRTAPRDAAVSGPGIVHQSLEVETREPLREELQSFIRCIQEGSQPVVSGSVGRTALAIALQIVEDIDRRRAAFANATR